MVTSARMSRSISQVPSIWSLEHARDTATCSSKKIPPTSSPVYDYVMLYMCPARARPTRVPFESHIFFLGFHPVPLYLTPLQGEGRRGEDERRGEKVSRKYEFLLFISFLFFPFFFFSSSPSLVGVNLKKINHRLSKPPKMLWISLSVKHRCKRRKN